MKVKEYLGVPENLRAAHDLNNTKPERLRYDRDSVQDRQKHIIELCDKPEGATSKELAEAVGYSQYTAITPMLKRLILSHKIYRDKWRYYKVQPAEPVLPEPVEKAIELGESIANHKNEDKLIDIVEAMAKDFVWQADCDINTVKRFVEYIKAKREGK